MGSYREYSSSRQKPKVFRKKGNQVSLEGDSLKALLKDVLKKGKKFRFQSKGFSMNPFIRNEDVLTLAPLSEEQAEVGDVVACAHPGSGKLIVHRIVRKKGRFYVIKGDNALKSDGQIPTKSIYGRVIKIERKGKRITFSLGPEKQAVALVSRDMLGRRVLCYLWSLIWLVRRGFVKNYHL
ncbi:MAG: hypothetical protein GF421_04970 [Candidatus Aminicenantes bacterium]|nr:hypothetical protein [Candidatus Aminicenantes bacterium]